MSLGFDPQTALDLVNQNVTRPYNYGIVLRLPDLTKDYIGLLSIDSMVKASSLPKMTVDHLDFKYKGRTIKVPNKVNYPGTWSCTFYLDETYFVREAIEKWMMMFDSYYDGTNGSSSMLGGVFVNKSKIFSTATVTQYSKMGTGIQAYEFQGLFPISLEEVPLADDRIGAVNEFTVTFAYSYYNIRNGSSLIGDVVSGIADDIGGAIGGSVGDAISSVGSVVGGFF